MREIKTLNEYANEILDNRENPHLLANINLELGVKYSIVSERYKPLKLKKAEFWQKKYADPKNKISDTYLDITWNASKEGIEEMRIKIELGGIAKLMSAIKTYLVQMSIEARNLN